MKILETYRDTFAGLPPEIRFAEAEAERETQSAVTLSDGARQGCAASDVTELFVRAGGDRTGFAYTQDLEEDPQAVIRRAFENSRWSRAEAPEPMNGPDACRELSSGEEPEAADIEALWEKAETIGSWLEKNVPGLDSYTLSVTDRVRTLGLVNTAGCDVCRAVRTVFVDLLAVKSGCGSLNEVYTFDSLAGVRPSLFEEPICRWEARIMEPAALTSGTYPCVLDGAVMTNILLTSWQMFTGRSFLSRNTPYAQKLGRTVAGPALSISDRVSVPGSGFRFPVDAEGTPGRDVEIIRDGVLTGLMHNLTTAAGMEAAPTGNGGRKTLLSGNIHTDMLVMPKNFGIRPGEGDARSLMARMGDGVYIFESFDQFHSINIGSGEFSIPCTGLLVKGGRPAGRLDGLTITGTVQELLAAVTAVGADDHVLPMVMLNSYAVHSPSVLVSGLSISQ